MANRKTPGSPKTWLQQVRRFLGLNKNRGGAKVGHAGPDERTIGPPPPPPHVPEVLDAVVVDEAKAERRRPRRKNKNKNPVVQAKDTISSPEPKQEGLGDPSCTLESLDSPVIIVATMELPVVVPAVAADAAPPVLAATPQEIPTADTDKDGWQLVARKKRHGGRAERPAQGLAIEHDPQVRATAKQQPRWTAWPSHQRPQNHARPWPPSPASTAQVRATPKHSTAKQQPCWTAWPSYQRPQHHARLWPPSPASTSSKSTPPQVTVQHGKREEEDADLGIKRMSEPEEGINQEEDSEGEEETDDEESAGTEEDDEMHHSYWIKDKETKTKDKSKTLCLICYLERRDPVPEIANKANKIDHHLKKFHKMQKKKGYPCQSKGCWVRARNRRDIGRHQFICHSL